LSSAYLEKGLIININTLGLEENSLRKVEDGFTYFGCKKSIKKVNRQTFNKTGNTGSSEIFEKEIVNDFVIPTKN